jgi:hypothetical protein
MVAAIPTSSAVTPICTNTSENAVPTDLAANRLGRVFPYPTAAAWATERRDREQRKLLRLDQDLHRSAAMRRDRRPFDVRREHH